MANLKSIKGREIWVVNVLAIGDETSSKSLIYENETDAKEYADAEIDDYATEWELNVTERSPHLYKAEDIDYEWYVTITIEKQMIL